MFDMELGGGRSILLSYRNVCGFFPYFQGFPAFRVRAPRAPNRPFFIRRFRRFLEISNIVVCSVMEHTTLLDFSFVILPPENRADKFFLPHVRYFLRRRTLYPAELQKHQFILCGSSIREPTQRMYSITFALNFVPYIFCFQK